MANITHTDSLFVSASAMGRQFYNFVGSGMDSFAQIIDSVRNSPGAPRGLVNITVRNASQGWARGSTFYNY